MNRLVVVLSIVLSAMCLLSCSPTVTQRPSETTQLAPSENTPLSASDNAQLSSTGKKAAGLEITKEPLLEGAREDFAIIRWTTKNPGGTDVHYGIVHYGTDPTHLNQTGRNPIRINRDNRDTVFRVRVPDLKPQTTYYYKVEATDANGRSHELESTVQQFTTPAPGERIVAFPPQAPN